MTKKVLKICKYINCVLVFTVCEYLISLCLFIDIVFFIYLYQRWIYRVDPKRMNEFGTSGEIEQQRSEANGTVCVANEEKPVEDKKKD